MTEELNRYIAAWATEVATQAAQLPSRQARAAFLAERRRELIGGAHGQGLAEPAATMLADSCIEGATKIMNALLARGGAAPEGRA
jgi:hypothetical protein